MKASEIFETIKESEIETIDFVDSEDFEEKATDLGYTVSSEGNSNQWKILIAKNSKDKISGAFNGGTNEGVLLKKSSKGVDDYQDLWDVE